MEGGGAGGTSMGMSMGMGKGNLLSITCHRDEGMQHFIPNLPFYSLFSCRSGLVLPSQPLTTLTSGKAIQAERRLLYRSKVVDTLTHSL